MIQWARLKSCLLSAAGAAHPAAAADCLAAAVQADAAAKEWLTTAADVFDQHLPDSAAMKAATSRVRSLFSLRCVCVCVWAGGVGGWVVCVCV